MSVGEGEVDMVEADGVESIPFAFHEEDCSGCGCCADDDSWIKDVYTLGTIFMPFATFEIDPTPPANILAWRFASFYDHENPSRLEYFWAKAGQLNGKGPPVPERSVDYQEYRLYVETGTEIVTAFTDLGLRSVDPKLNANTTSYSDMSAGVKTLLLNRDRLKLSHTFHDLYPVRSSGPRIRNGPYVAGAGLSWELPLGAQNKFAWGAEILVSDRRGSRFEGRAPAVWSGY